MGIKRTIGNVAKRILKNRVYTNHKEYVVQVTENNQRFKGKVALVTGGSGEIGRAICLRLSVEGAAVYVGGRNRDSTERVATEIRALGGSAKPVTIDVTNVESIASALNDIVSETGKIDILVNCAGGSARGMNLCLHEQAVEVIDHLLDTNLRGSMLCSREAAKYMIKQRDGKIINIASVIGIRGKPRFTGYAASKAGIIGYTTSLATELGQFGVNVNCISPGFIQRGVYTERKLPYLLSSNYMHRVGTPEDIAFAAAFLASTEANFITGQNLCVDGGRSLGLRGDE